MIVHKFSPFFFLIGHVHGPARWWHPPLCKEKKKQLFPKIYFFPALGREIKFPGHAHIGTFHLYISGLSRAESKVREVGYILLLSLCCQAMASPVLGLPSHILPVYEPAKSLWHKWQTPTNTQKARAQTYQWIIESFRF